MASWLVRPDLAIQLTGVRRALCTGEIVPTVTLASWVSFSEQSSVQLDLYQVVLGAKAGLARLWPARRQ